MIEKRGIFHYFLAYIKHDFHARRCLRVSPDWQEELACAHAAAPSVSPVEIDMLFTILGVECTEQLAS